MKKKILILTILALGFSDYAAAISEVSSTPINQTLTLTVLSVDTLTLSNYSLTSTITVGGVPSPLQSVSWNLNLGSVYSGNRSMYAELTSTSSLTGITILLATAVTNGNGIPLGTTTLQKNNYTNIVNNIARNSSYTSSAGTFQYSVQADQTAQPGSYVATVTFTVEAEV